MVTKVSAMTMPGFQPGDMAIIRGLVIRGLSAGLIGSRVEDGVPSILWTVSDQGWIFEARITNIGRAEYHGYPVRPSEAIADLVYARFSTWARLHGGDSDRQAAVNCQALHGFR